MQTPEVDQKISPSTLARSEFEKVLGFRKDQSQTRLVRFFMLLMPFFRKPSHHKTGKLGQRER